MENKEDISFIKEIEKDIKRDKLFKLFLVYKKFVIIGTIIVVMILAGYSGNKLYQKHKADRNSVVFSEVKDAMSAGDLPKALLLLDQLINEGTDGYVFVSYLEKVNILMAQGRTLDVLATLKEASKVVSLPSYYKDMLKSLEFMARMNNNEGEDLVQLSGDMKANLRTEDPFYFHNLEMYAATLFMLNQYEESLKTYTMIIEAKDKAPADIIDRAKRAKAVLISLK
ncbi:MAG: tetratricopeptide repeat protein [Alphaproteobacteria bacterium]|jgi:hypothetical protein|nr:tetratricopeptide repeat protein [Alphaproteobacteria bacterium]